MAAIAPIVIAVLVIIGATMLCLGRARTSARPILFAVEGLVFVNGDPAENVNVAFHSVNGDMHAFCPVGRTDSKGIFSLSTYSSADGAPAGEYNVTFVWHDPTIEFDECECSDPLIHDRFKGLYATADSSGYQAEVGVASNSFRFNVWRPRDEDPLP